MKIPSILATTLLLTSEVVVGQTPTAVTSPDPQTNNMQDPAKIQQYTRSLEAMRADNPYKGVSGSPYLVTRWLPATITTRTKAVMQAVPLKYDVLEQHLLTRDPQKGDSMQLNDDFVVSFVLTDPNRPQQKREFRRFLEAPVPAQTREFVEVLHQGKYTLLKQYGKEVQRVGYKDAANFDDRPTAIDDKVTYYLARANGPAMPIKLKLKALQSAAPDLASALKEASGKQAIATEDEVIVLLQAVDKP
ncbi:hypothetical protein [Hymenobacter cavernae]|nr:hypothetical protein [Hymenobacter cavernae]